MKSFIASALVATYVAAQGDWCDAYVQDVDDWLTYDDCFIFGDLATCEYICDYGGCDNEAWWWDSEISDACDIAYGPTNLGTMLRDALESIDVDVDGIIAFLSDKGFELEQMQLRHQDEVETFFEEAGLEAEEQFADDVEKIQNAVIDAVQSWANSLSDYTSPIKRMEAKKRHGKVSKRSNKRHQAEEAAVADSGSSSDGYDYTETDGGIAWEIPLDGADEAMPAEDTTDSSDSFGIVGSALTSLEAAWSMCRDVQDAGVCEQFCYADLTPEAWRRQACKWQSADGLSDNTIYYDNCRDGGDADWCAYACTDATAGNSWYFESEKEHACDNDDWESDRVIDWDEVNSTFVEIRDGCMNDLNADQCANICDAPEYELIPDDVRELACAWREADNLGDGEIFYTRCRDNGELAWCQYACIDATNGNSWYYDYEREEACDAVASDSDSSDDEEGEEVAADDDGTEAVADSTEADAAADRKRMMKQKMIDMRAHEAKMAAKRSTAGVSLASKGVAVESESSNAGYYIAGASILSAAAVAFIVMKKKGEKVSSEPLLASDDGFKASM